jgi:hypothetical protein
MILDLAPLLLMITGASIIAAAFTIRQRGAVTKAAANVLHRLLAILPGGRIHEKHVRARLGMAPGHPESCTKPGSWRERDQLAVMQARIWPKDEWVDVIRYHMDGAQ